MAPATTSPHRRIVNSIDSSSAHLLLPIPFILPLPFFAMSESLLMCQRFGSSDPEQLSPHDWAEYCIGAYQSACYFGTSSSRSCPTQDILGLFGFVAKMTHLIFGKCLT